MKLLVTNIQRFSTHDGDGIRTTVFLKGCPLHCIWCHNPETQSSKQQIFFTAQNCIGCGACIAVCENHAHYIDKENNHRFDVTKCTGCTSCVVKCPSGSIEATSKPMSLEEIMTEVLKDKAFYGKTGGITLSGGEPLMNPVECIELLKMAKANGISTAIETSGYFDKKYIPQLAEYTDVFLWDIKDSDIQRHIKYTGVHPGKIQENLFALDKFEVKILLRCIIIIGVNDNEEHYRALAETYNKLKHCIGVELLPYHAFGGGKMVQLGYSDNGKKEWIPTETDMQQAKLCLEQMGVYIKTN
ncbi:MAG: glycyl-radical enzyme activating protein [Saccharofermentanales bacterium]